MVVIVTEKAPPDCEESKKKACLLCKMPAQIRQEI